MKDRIAFVTTGGTIGSILRGSHRAIEPSGAGLRQTIAELCDRHAVSYEVRSPVSLGSEDADPHTWATIAHSVQDCLRDGIANVLVTHGTDTLPYTAAVLSLLFSRRRAKICITGSLRGPEHPQSDVTFNLRATLEAVFSDVVPDGVYVVFPEVGRPDRAAVMQALDVKPIMFDELGMRSRYDRTVAVFTMEGGVRASRPGEGRELKLTLDDRRVPAPMELQGQTERIFYQTVYPGFSLERVMHDRQAFDAIVLGLYHSGTASSLNYPGSILSYLRSPDRCPVVMGALPLQHISHPYYSTSALVEAGAKVYGEIQAYQLYTILVVGLAQGRTVDEVLALMEPYRVDVSDRPRLYEVGGGQT